MPLGTGGFESTVFASTGSPAAAIPMASAIGAAAAAKEAAAAACSSDATAPTVSENV